MPSLRFSRDKRGYEITSLVLQSHRHGKAGPRVLYWFRTPPNVRVGRAAIDEEAIRALEQSHPEVAFDWRRILHTVHTEAQPGVRGSNPKRPRTARQGERSRRAQRPPLAERPLDLRAELPGATDDLLTALVGDSQTTPTTGEEAGAVVNADAGPPAALEVAAGVIGSEELSRLRARYADVLARIGERVSDPARADALKRKAESLNPDAWVTPEAVRAGVAAFDRQVQHLHGLLGRRRRSRRGGGRHRRGTSHGGNESDPPSG